MNEHLLLVEDDNAIAVALRLHLEGAGYRLHREADGRRAMAAIDQQRFDLVLLDLMLPGADGWEVCRHLRARHADTPVIMLSARSAEAHRVLGLELGADDYVAKPFSMRELLLRIKAILRRLDKPTSTVPELAFGRLKVDEEGHRVWVDGDEVSLTALEFRLLSTFLSRKGRVQTRDALLHDVWGHTPGLPTRTVDTHVQRLRKKLGPASDYIETLRGVGYRFRTDSAEATSA